MSYSVDLNILIDASDGKSARNRAALDFLASCQENPEPLCLAWPTIMGYLRVSTHPSVLKAPLRPLEARANIESLVELPQVRLLSEGRRFWDLYCEITDSLPVRGNLVPDAHLAAILLEHGVRTIYTRDRDFRKFDALKVLEPYP